MGCCDRSRRAARPSRRHPPPRAAQTSAGPARPQPPRVHYLGHRAIEVRGGVTGRTYRFDPRNRTQSVDPRDVAGLLRTKVFRQA